MGKLINTDDIPWDVEGVGFIPVIGKDEIDEMPEAVVRCKDCKNFVRHDHRCGMMNHGFKDDFFCAWGERREDEAD